MPKPLSFDLRERAMSRVLAGESVRSVVTRYLVVLGKSAVDVSRRVCPREPVNQTSESSATSRMPLRRPGVTLQSVQRRSPMSTPAGSC